MTESNAPPEEIDLTNLHELRRLLFAHHMRPNKSFGQNFLVDRSTLMRIVEAAEIDADDAVLEVGAGIGVLTRELAKRARQVVAVELERDMLTLLAETTSVYANVELIARNLLYLDPVEVFGQAPYKLVANLPYYITAPTFRHFLESANPPRLLVVMVQYEVAQRIVAGPGDLSVLGVSIQFYGQPKIIARVPASSFYPAPKVDSAIVRVDVNPQAPLTPEERERFFRIVQAGFSQRRKQLHNSLTHALHPAIDRRATEHNQLANDTGTHIDLMQPTNALRATAPQSSGLQGKTTSQSGKLQGARSAHEEVLSWLTVANIDASRRAETLSIEEWLRLWRCIEHVL